MENADAKSEDKKIHHIALKMDYELFRQLLSYSTEFNLGYHIHIIQAVKNYLKEDGHIAFMEQEVERLKARKAARAAKQ